MAALELRIARVDRQIDDPVAEDDLSLRVSRGTRAKRVKSCSPSLTRGLDNSR